MKVAMVLSAGLGTRLRPLTEHVPKPLCPVGDRPQIDHILDALARGGIERAVVNTHHLHEQFDDAWAKRQPLDVVRIHEPEILGTGGGIANAADALGDGPVLVWNADILASFDVAELLAGAHDPVTVVVGPKRARGEATMGLTHRGTVARVRAARSGVETESADYAGIAVLSKSARERLRVPGCLVGDFLVPMVEGGEEVATFPLTAPFRDTGSLGEYLQANLDWLAARELSSYVDASAAADPGVVLKRCVISADARIHGEGAVNDAVIWSNAVVHAPLERAIATNFAVLRVD